MLKFLYPGMPLRALLTVLCQPVVSVFKPGKFSVVFCTGKYRWHGSAEAYTGREVQDIPGVLAVFAERRKDSFGPYVRLMSVTLN